RYREGDRTWLRIRSATPANRAVHSIVEIAGSVHMDGPRRRTRKRPAAGGGTGNRRISNQVEPDPRIARAGVNEFVGRIQRYSDLDRVRDRISQSDGPEGCARWAATASAMVARQSVLDHASLRRHERQREDRKKGE